ncbi:hypothetical protein [Candidatus Lokiarchaeum ossiferum]|uniref:hypothetical protein n=1 Tax=Candidatus Lokiarchaeum ossiferum TaxID=2951803 RepID=UPI00352E27DE
MAKVKGKFISLAVSLMGAYKEAQAKADEYIFKQTNLHYNKLDQEGWYDTKIFAHAMDAYAKASPTGDRAYVTLGQKVYPTIKKTSGLPPTLKTPLDYILFEAEGFKANHKGNGLKPRKFIKKDEGDVIVEAEAPDYSCKLYKGVFLGILEMAGINTGKVEQTKCTTKGDATCEFHITW